MSFLQLRSVSKHYGSVPALDGFDLDVASGSRTAVVGPSGSGKTTLLRIIGGFEAPDAGSVMLDGTVLASDTSWTPPHRRGIGIVAQDGALFPHLSIAENIGYGLPRRDAGRDARIRDLMAMTGLDAGLLRRRPDQISGGQQQRVALARALARQPRLILLDEPFSALDPGLRAQTREAVSDLLAAAGVTTILVTHDQTEALSFADQVVVMRLGRLQQAGSPHDVYLRPVDPVVAEFMGEMIRLPARIDDGVAFCALGSIAVDTDRRGDAEIMLRPEQVSCHAAGAFPAGGAANDEVSGEVISVAFAGSDCSMLMELRRRAGEPGPAVTRIRLRAVSTELPKIGDRIGLIVIGKAHVFPDCRGVPL